MLSVSVCVSQVTETPVAGQNSEIVEAWQSASDKVKVKQVSKAGVDVTDPAPLPQGPVLRESSSSPCRLPGVRGWTAGGSRVSSNRTSSGSLMDRQCQMSLIGNWAADVPLVFWPL